METRVKNPWRPHAHGPRTIQGSNQDLPTINGTKEQGATDSGEVPQGSLIHLGKLYPVLLHANPILGSTCHVFQELVITVIVT